VKDDKGDNPIVQAIGGLQCFPRGSLPTEGKDEKMKKHVKVWPLVWFVAVCMMCTLLPTSAARADDESRIRRGFEIAPVPLNLHGHNRALVGLGSYIVNAQGGCNDCHTYPSYKPAGNPFFPFFGETNQVNTDEYLAGGREFGPFGPFGPYGFLTFTGGNLTPDSTGLPAGLTFAEFLDVMRKGINFGPPHPPLSLLQVMPWPVYSDMTDRDLRAIYEYLRAIPSRPDNPPPGP
jgi:hypothetical protein